MTKNLTLIIGHNSVLAQNFIKRHILEDIIVIGRNINNTSFPFFQFDLSQKITEKDFEALDRLICSNKIRSIIWFAGSHNREELYKSTKGM